LFTLTDFLLIFLALKKECSQKEIEGIGMNQSRITINPSILGGKPIVRGMRISVANVLEMLAGGMSTEQILEDFPYLEKEDIDACLQYAPSPEG